MARTKHIVPLEFTLSGQKLQIYSIPQGPLRVQFIRIGLHEGVKVVCFERLPGGTVVLEKNRQHIAVGRALAKQILVVVLHDEES